MSLYDKIHDLPTGEKHLIDLVSLSAMLGAMTENLPQIAAGFTMVWTAIRIWETDTLQNALSRFRKTSQN